MVQFIANILLKVSRNYQPFSFLTTVQIVVSANRGSGIFSKCNSASVFERK